METFFSIGMKCLFVGTILFLIWYGRWTGVFACLIPICITQLTVPVPLSSYQGYTGIIYFIPVGVIVVWIKMITRTNPIQPSIDSSHSYTVIRDGKILAAFLSLFFFIIIINYLRSGLDIYLISSGINFSMFYSRVLVPCFILFVLPSFFASKKDLKTLLIGLTLGALILLLDALLKWFGYNVNITNIRGQAGAIHNPIYIRFGQLSKVALYLFPIAIAFLEKDIIKHITALIIILLSVMSGGRIVTGAIVISYAFYLFYHKGRMPLYIKASICILSFVLILGISSAGFISIESVNNINQRIFNKNKFQQAFAGRFSIYKKSLSLFSQNPLFGIGPINESMKNRMLIKHIENSAEFLAREGTHATYINILAINGLIAFIIYLSIYFLIIKILLQLNANIKDPFLNKYSLMLVIYFLINSIRIFVEGVAEGGDWYFYLNIGILLIILKIIKIDDKEKKKSKAYLKFSSVAYTS